MKDQQLLQKLQSTSFPNIAISVNSSLSPSNLRSVSHYPIQLIEYRGDLADKVTFETLHENTQKLKKAKRPILLTLRSKKEGGSFPLSESQRKTFYEKLMPEIDAIDIEINSGKILSPIIESAKEHQVLRIASYHNFKSTPTWSDLKKTLNKFRKTGAQVFKIATHAHNREDLLRLLKLNLDHPAIPMICIAMGPMGQISRVFFPLTGSLLTYSFLGQPKAPGQIPLKQLLNHLKPLYPQNS